MSLIRPFTRLLIVVIKMYKKGGLSIKNKNGYAMKYGWDKLLRWYIYILTLYLPFAYTTVLRLQRLFQSIK